jgi:serine/threonine protein kinase
MVAVKVLFPEVAQDRVAAARFRNEIFASYGVSHPNVVRAYEYLRDGDIVAYTMEYVGGGDLAERLGRVDDLVPVPEAMRILSQMCSGVQAIHDAGIVHRDLKPENILLTKEGSVKIADFGIARTGQGPRLTEHGGVVGTIDYVSPEYMFNSQVDWRSDIYALGILAYEMITGEPPFRGDSVYATMNMRLKTDPSPPSTIRPECPPELDRIVLKAMARNPEERYQSAAEMMYDLQALMPEQSAMSGAYPVLSKTSSKSYVGPSLNNAPEASGSAAHSERAPADNKGFDKVQDGPLQQVSASHSDKANALNGMFGKRGTQGVQGATPPVNTSVASPASSYEESPLVVSSSQGSVAYQYAAVENNTQAQQRMESVLANPVSFDKAGVTFQGMDSKRLRELQQTALRGRSSVIQDLFIAMMAILIGVGVGFGVMAYFYPKMLPKHPVVDLMKSWLEEVEGRLGIKPNREAAESGAPGETGESKVSTDAPIQAVIQPVEEGGASPTGKNQKNGEKSNEKGDKGQERGSRNTAKKGGAGESGNN